MIDMPVSIIFGAAFNDVVNVLLNRVLIPPLSLLAKYVLREAMQEAEKISIG